MQKNIEQTEKIFTVYPEYTEQIQHILNLLGEEPSYFKMYFLHMYALPHIRMGYQLKYLEQNLPEIIKLNIIRNREDLIMKMIWIYWITTIPEEYDEKDIKEMEQKENISFADLAEQLNQILVFTLGEENITYDPNEILNKISLSKKMKH